jgi:hypothetical protein
VTGPAAIESATQVSAQLVVQVSARSRLSQKAGQSATWHSSSQTALQSAPQATAQPGTAG